MMAGVFSGLLGMLCSCGASMPESELVSVEYTTSTMRANHEYEAHVELQPNGDVLLRAMKKNYGPLVEKKVDASALKRLREIIKENKMYAYKEAYKLFFDVKDGRMWSFHAKFADGQSISSHGSNAWPNGDGLKQIKAYVTELIGDDEPQVVEGDDESQNVGSEDAE